jgi:fumarate hydratase subunit beta
MAEHKITTPVTDKVIEKLRAGDKVFITGFLLTGRDAAHKKLIDLVKEGKELPVDIKGQFIYYVGPTPARPGKPIGSAGPTTSYRMDSYAPTLHALGLKGTIGKGKRSKEVKQALKEHPELGPEAIIRLKVRDFPCIVINDMYDGDLYEEGKKKYRIE